MIPRRLSRCVAAISITAMASVMATAADDRPGYLETSTDLTTVVPPPPQRGDPRFDADRRVFRITRAALPTPRGALATRDVPDTVPDVMRALSCAAGVALSPETTPATFRLLSNADADTARANNLAKAQWKRPRPFLTDRGPVCQDKALLAQSYDYPSGHTTRAWTAGLILSDLEPDRAGKILKRALSFGESRVVCGAHTLSAVEAGRLGATISLQSVRQSSRYQSDFVAAKAEINHQRDERASVPPEPAVCTAEEALVAQSVLASLQPKHRTSR